MTTIFANTLQDELNYSFTLEVTNNGKTASTTASMVFSDNDVDVETVSIPALEPDQSYEVTFNWNGTGKAGSHELAFEADNTNTVKEFSETNNSLVFTLEVPALFYSLETDPPDKLSYPANTPINIVTRLINNQETPILLTLDLSIINDESGVMIHNRIKEEQITAFDSKIITDTFNTAVYPAGNYEIWLKHNEEILSLAELSAISAVKPSQTIGIYPRVLIMNLLPLAARGTLFVKTAPLDPRQKLLINPVDYLSVLLQSQGIEYEIGFHLIDSYLKFNKGQANVNIVLGNKMGRNLRDELKEKVWYGEGLILFCDTLAQNPEWKNFLGVTIKPIPGKTRETVIQILPNKFCSEGEIEFPRKLKLQMIKEKEDVVIIAQTKQKQYPVITYRKCGKGHILIINKSFCGGGQGGAVFSKSAPPGHRSHIRITFECYLTVQSGYLYRFGFGTFVAS